MSIWRRPLVIILALALDTLFGDPPNRWHPVAWMGAAIGRVRKLAPKEGRARPFAAGALISLGGGRIVAGLGAFLEALTRLIPGNLGLLSEAYILKTTIGLRGLSLAGAEVQRALAAGDLPEARRLLSWHLVSRDTSALSAAQVAGATVESVAENASDGVLAPLFYYAVGGLPAALAYRYVNTGDAMLGYHDAEREWLGKAPARLDDLLNLLPARLTALLLLALSPLIGADRRRAWAIWRRDAHTTASPNAGHPMSAMAGALGVELEKVGHYRLGAGQSAPAAEDIRRSVRLVKLAAVAGAGILACIAMMKTRQD